jgi:hypothetical protein
VSIEVVVNTAGLTDPNEMQLGTIIDHNAVSGCDTGISLTRVLGGSVAHNQLAGNTNGIGLTAASGLDIDHNLDFDNLNFVVPPTTPTQHTVHANGSP